MKIDYAFSTGSQKNRIDCFDGEYAFLSNFYNSPFEYDGIIYSTNEHFFQAMKTHNIKEREKIAAAATPGSAKRLGRSVELRADWNTVRIMVMKLGLYLKFTSSPELRDKLVATGNLELIEGNTWNDTYWGMCNNKGENMLGKCLMELRELFVNFPEIKLNDVPDKTIYQNNKYAEYLYNVINYVFIF